MSHTLNINGNPYQFNPKLTLSDMSIILDASEIERIPYRTIISKTIENSIIENQKIKSPSLNQIILSNDSVFTTYIEIVISENNYLSTFYWNRSTQEEPCERFCKACKDYFKKEMSTLTETILKISLPLESLAHKLAPGFSIIQQKMESISRALAPALNYITTIGKQLSESFKELSNDQKQIDWDAWQKSFEQWGSYGWAIINHAPIGFQTSPPKSQIDADKQALLFFKKTDLLSLWSDLKEHPFSSKEITDIDEAIFCFNARKYKASSLIICALIDGVSIKKQDHTERISVGTKAIVKIKNDFNTTSYAAAEGFIFMYCKNLLKCLFTLFANTNDFKTEPPRYNRNFVSHGMSKRKVLRKDCIKLFLILNNLMHLTELCYAK